MPIMDAMLFVHGTGAALGAISSSGGYLGDTLFTSADEYSALELDLGAAFPGSVEGGYTFPPEIVGAGGVEFGLHILVTRAFDTLTTINFLVLSSAATEALYNTAGNVIASRELTLAQLAIAGAHYFISIPLQAMKRFNRFYADGSGSPNVYGKIAAWYGPRTGGEQ